MADICQQAGRRVLGRETAGHRPQGGDSCRNVPNMGSPDSEQGRETLFVQRSEVVKSNPR